MCPQRVDCATAFSSFYQAQVAALLLYCVTRAFFTQTDKFEDVRAAGK
jgi:hypothetical protein